MDNAGARVCVEKGRIECGVMKGPNEAANRDVNDGYLTWSVWQAHESRATSEPRPLEMH